MGGRSAAHTDTFARCQHSTADRYPWQPFSALIGGLLFGVGMIMSRGCASRFLILSANGNLRALLSGLIFAVTAHLGRHSFVIILAGLAILQISRGI